jgi:predicted class III extradiol MEMO1 family dioxygenase
VSRIGYAFRFRAVLADAVAPTAVVPKALIAPHAGYVYSGRVAAAAFTTLRGGTQAIERAQTVSLTLGSSAFDCLTRFAVSCFNTRKKLKPF